MTVVVVTHTVFQITKQNNFECSQYKKWEVMAVLISLRAFHAVGLYQTNSPCLRMHVVSICVEKPTAAVVKQFLVPALPSPPDTSA